MAVCWAYREVETKITAEVVNVTIPAQSLAVAMRDTRISADEVADLQYRLQNPAAFPTFTPQAVAIGSIDDFFPAGPEHESSRM